MPFKTPLEAAIAYLISKGTVKSTADVARDLQMKSRGTVTSYATGVIPIAQKFQTRFESYYKIKLADFDENGLRTTARNLQPVGTDKIDQVLILLTQIAQQVQTGNQKLNGLEQMQIVSSAMQNQYVEYFVSLLNKEVDAAQQVQTLQRIAFEKLTGSHVKNNPVVHR